MKLFASIVTTGKFWDNRTKACLETWLPQFEEVKLIQKGAAIPPQWLKPCGILAV